MTKENKKSVPSGLELLRKKFEPHQISKLPKQASWMTQKKDEYKNCSICGGYHHPKAVHLDYVGHAALTDRLLDCDPQWNWEPISFKENGAPYLDENGGMWIRLTVCGVSRIGYGHPDGKKGGDANKEVIGDALRNAAMRFGAALDLWHKGDLHVLEEDEKPKEKQKTQSKPQEKKPDPMAELCGKVKQQLNESETVEVLDYVWKGFQEKLQPVKDKQPKWYAALETQFNQRMSDLTQKPEE